MEFMTGVKTTDLLELAELQNKELIGQTVKVNGAVETQRGKKLVDGDEVTYDGKSFKIISK